MRVLNGSRLVGRAGWWSFIVVSCLVGGVWWLPDNQARQLDFAFIGNRSAGTLTFGTGDGIRRYADYQPASWFGSIGSISTFGMVAFIVVVAAAVVEAAAIGRWGRGIVTIAVPFLCLLLVACTLPDGRWGFQPSLAISVFGVLIAVAIRETWGRLSVTAAEPR